jgi:hypothetical protein
MNGYLGNKKPMLRRQAALAADAPVTFPLQIGTNQCRLNKLAQVFAF